MNMNIGKVSGLTGEEQEMLEDCVATYAAKLARNMRRVTYYEQKMPLRDLGISIPPHLRGIKTVVGWPTKAVDALAVRSRFDSFVFQGEPDPDLTRALRASNFKTLYSQLVTSELIHSCAFVTVTRGAASEPPVIISAYDATRAAALWNHRAKRIKCGITVIETDRRGQPAWIDFFTDEALLTLRAHPGGWDAERFAHQQGRPLMEALVYRPTLTRPFGKSRISRAVMSITDNAVREALRTEVSAEFFTTPQKYLLGAADELFNPAAPGQGGGDGDGGAGEAEAGGGGTPACDPKQSKWEAYIGSILAITRDENGELPQVGQFPQMTMQPHIDYMRSLAAQFSGETGVPMSSLGVAHDNPASAEAIYAGKEDLIIEAQELNATNGDSLRNVGLLAMATLRNVTVDKLDDNAMSIIAKFRPVDKPSEVSRSDAAIKQASAAPWLAETTVFLEHLGFSEDEIARMRSEKRVINAIESMKRLTERTGTVYDQPR
jgi:hypothetical protein